MPVEHDITSFFEPPAYALLIGISRYLTGVESGQPLQPNQFTDLKCAARDATDLERFLKNNGFLPEAVMSLLDDKATLREIKRGFAWLRRNCDETEKPLVIVFFSGHGMADARKDHYLIPYDGERDQLAETALWSRDFRNYLDALNTDRLVVFLDACHAGGVGIEGAKGALPEFNAYGELGEGTGRCIIASCGPGQYSYEGETNSIFTGHLLELLEGEGIDADPINVFSLYNALKEKVKQTARVLRQAEQVPLIEAKSTTGITLAINKRLRAKRRVEQEQISETRRAFLEMVCEALSKSDYSQRLIVIRILRQYVERKDTYANHEDFYGLFDQYAVSSWPIENVSRALIAQHRELEARVAARDRPGEADVSSRESPQNRAAARDAFVSVRGTNRVMAEAAAQPRRMVASNQQEARRLAEGDEDYILGDLKLSPLYFVPVRRLIACLREPVTVEGFMQLIHDFSPGPGTEELDALLVDVVARFTERWRAAEAPARALSTLITEKSQA